MYSASAESLVTLTHNVPYLTRVAFTHNRGSSIAANRNLLVEALLDVQDLAWLCMIDSDMVVKPDTVNRLLATGKDIISALCFTRYPPYPVAARFCERGPISAATLPRLNQVEMAGTACLLIRRHVLETIPYPWFEHPVPGYGEDEVFCRKVRAAGFEIWLDGTTEVGHVGTSTITSDFARAWHRAQDGAAGIPTLRRSSARSPDGATKETK
jgi:GT2 family glycosyltransferase